MRAPPLILSAITLALAAGCKPTTSPPDTRRVEIERMYAGYRDEAFAGVPDITAEALHARLPDDAVVLVDCREDDERAVSIIPGSISKTQFEADAGKYRDHLVVTYCTIGYRSGVYGKTLIADSFDTVNLQGGVLEWAHTGGEFIDADGKTTRRVHVYGRTWDLLPDDYTSVY